MSDYGLLTVRPTADPGERLSDERRWDEPTRPTHEEPAAATYPPAQQAASQHLVDIHDGLRAELEQVRDIVAQVRRGQLGVGPARSAVNTMTMRQNNWTLGAYCESYCRIVTGHHTLEDRAVFPHLRRSEMGLGPVLDRLEEEHEVIAEVLDELDRALVALVGSESTDDAALDVLQQKVDLLTDALLSHLAYEERELIGPLARHGFN
jgi:iron-sulfur cluster repair protein YtfE (RIC family)